MPFAPNNDAGGVVTPPSAQRHGRALAFAAAALILAVAVGLWSIRELGAAARIDADARAYVTLALGLGRVAPGEVDTFFGPAALAPPADAPAPRLTEMRAGAARLLVTIDRDHARALAPRRAALAGQVRHLIRLIDTIQADATQADPTLRFDDEAQRLYGVAIGAVDPRPRRAALAQLAALLPGAAALPERVAAFRTRLAIPAARRPAVFARALAECRRRTRAHWPLPADERIAVRWSDAVPAAWQRYLGGQRSILEINPQAIGFVGAVIDLACHEAYPGHHAQFIAMEQMAGPGGLPIEQRVVLLRSAESLLREGAANYGMRLAFPLAQRTAFARDVLYPLAGLPPRDAERDMRVHQLLGDLELSVVPILRAYRDGALPFDAAATALRNEALIASPAALLRFVDQYGAFVIGYTIARDRVAAQVAARGAHTHQDAWTVLRMIIATSDSSALAPVHRAATCPRPRPR